MNEIISVLTVSAIPVSEIRGGLPLAIYYGFDPMDAYFISLIGNIIPIPFLLLSLEYLVSFATKIQFLDSIYGKILKRIESKREFVEKYGYIGLIMFVSIPLPITGAWTGTLIAFLLQMNKIKSLISIFTGVCIAGFIVLLTSLGVISVIFIK